MPENLYEPDCIRTYSGKYINVVSPSIANIEAVDIAVGLARECRFGNHTQRFYSVAEHSIWCADKAALMFPDDADLPFKVLLHDAHEAYLKDIPSPVKRFIKAEYESMARKIQLAIHIKFGVSISHRDVARIHAVDVMALEWEFQHKMNSWTGHESDEKTRVELFIKEMVRLSKGPVFV